MSKSVKASVDYPYLIQINQIPILILVNDLRDRHTPCPRRRLQLVLDPDGVIVVGPLVEVIVVE